MTTDTDYRPLVVAGRCRSGRRWFWTAVDVRTGEARAEGWADDQVEAEEAMLEAGRQMGDRVRIYHATARWRLRDLNEQRRAQRPAPATRDTRPVEYLYRCYWSDEGRLEWVRMPVTKKTARRIYFRAREWGRGTYFVDRHRLEAERSVYHHPLRDLVYLEPDEPKVANPREELHRLRLEMADAHPDRGGTSEAFIAARRRYEAARARLGRVPA